MDDTALKDLLHNTALLVTLVVVFDLAISRNLRILPQLRQLLVGVILGCIGIGIILAAFQLEPGIIFDTRSVLLAVSGLFLGTVPTVIAMVLTAALRIAQGGAAAWTGVSVILASGCIGIVWRHLRKGSLADISWRELYGLGVVVHVVMLALMLTLPWESAQRVLAGIGLPVLLIYPAATAALGAFLANRMRRENLAAELAESEERLRLTLQAANQGLYDLNVQTGETKVSPEYATMLGYDPAEFIETNARWIERLHPDDHAVTAGAYRAYINGETPEYRVEFRQRTKAGDWKWILSIGSIVERDAAGRPLRMLGTHTDITARKQAEHDLRERKERLRLALEAANMGLWDRDLTTNALHWSDTEQRLMGYEPGTFPGTNEAFLALIHPDCEPAHKAAQQRVRSGDGVFHVELHFRCKDGRERWGLLCGKKILDESGRAVRIVGVDMDITERKQVEAELARERSLMRTLIDQLPDAIYVKDLESRFLLANTAVAQIMGAASPAELLGKTDADFYPATLAAAFRADEVQVLAGQPLRNKDESVRSPDGSTHCVLLTSKLPFRDQHGQVIGLVGVSHDITERRQAEAALLRSENLFRSIWEKSQDAMRLTDGQGKVLLVNQAFCDLFGKTRQEIEGQSLIEVYAADQRQRVLQRYLARYARREFEVYMERKLGLWNGRAVWLAASTSLLDPDEPAPKVLDVFRDITARKQGEEQLQAARDFYLQVLQEAPALIWRAGLDAKCNWFNKSWLDFTGRTLAQEQGDGWTEGVHADDMQRCVRTYLDAFAAHLPFAMEYRLRHHSGEHRWILDIGQPLKSLTGEFAGYIGYCFDITERKQTIEALRASEQLLSAFIQHSPIHAYIKEVSATESRVLIASDNFREMIGIPGAEMAGKTMAELFPAEFAAKITADDWAVVSQRSIIRLDEDLNGRNYTTIKFPIFLGGKHLLAGYTIDITERKRMEQERVAMEAQMRQQQKLESIGTLAAGVAHEINNPINGVMNYAQLIMDENAASPTTAEYAKEIIHETERVATIVRNLLQFARQEKSSHSPAQLQDVINQTLSLIRMLIRRDQITLQVELPPDLPEIKCRSQQIQQVLMNLLTNARDALNQRYAGHHDDKIIRLSSQPFERENRRWVRITVADHGVGIPVEVQGRIFDPFFSTKTRHEGTGLGLAISHGIVKDHHGRLWFETAVGEGTKFHVELPVDNGWEL